MADFEIVDPWEGLNRRIFAFNEGVDKVVLEPVARSYEWLVPRRLRRGVGNFFSNLAHPIYIVSDLVRLRFDSGARNSGRFLVNSTIGVAGLFDVADHWGLERQKGDMGLALADYGVPAGPYLVLPFLGPATLRDTLGFILDSAAYPLTWLGATNVVSRQDARYLNYGFRGVAVIHTRSEILEAVSAGRESSLDFYYFAQSTYYQYRRGLFYGDKAPFSEDYEEDQLFDDEDWLD